MRTMLKGLTAAVFAAGLAAAAHAETKPGAPTPAPTTSAAKPVKDKIYCVESTHTGTRIRRKDCRTRAEWLQQEGFDPLDPK